VILERFCKEYKLEDGPQTADFTCQILASNSAELGGSQEGHAEDLEKLGYGKDGDRQLVESILNFSRILLQNCGNRSIYASSSHLNSLLNSTSLSLLESTLLLGSELAQRYQAAMKRPAIRHASKDLLKNHYNIDLEKVTQLALPFTKTIVAPVQSAQPATPATPATPVTPSIKGKEKASFNTPAPKATSSTLCASDLVSFVKGASGVSSSPKSLRNGVSSGSAAPEIRWEQWGDVKVTYYPKPSPESDSASNGRPRNDPMTIPVWNTSTPSRQRNSNLGPNARRQVSSDGSPSPVSRSATSPSDDTPQSNYKVVEISSSKLMSTDLHTLLSENVSGMPPETQYELLTKLRVASALTTSLETRRQMLSVRLLAITNLAYIHPENTFLESVLKQDSEEPRRLQLVYQLAELVHPPADGDIAVPLELQTLAMSALDAISQHATKFTDVCAALNTNVNHGVLLYVVRKAVAEMANDDDFNNKVTVEDRWRNALFSLLTNISANSRTASDLVTAGLIQILVEVLTLRSNIAERYFPKVIGFLDAMMFGARDSFQTLVSADGLDAVSDLIVFEVKSAQEKASLGEGTRPEHRSVAVDYDIPFFPQQTIKWLFKFVHHLMSTAGGFGGNFDRLLRNLIDSSQLLGSLRQIIENANVYGSIVWTNAVSILNDFINNEPTSYAVIAEAGLSKGFLEAITGTEIVMPQDTKTSQPPPAETNDPSATSSSPAAPSDDDDDDSSDDEGSEPQRPSLAKLQAPREGPLAKGIMPTSETINIIPQAFGAICLNNSGMKMFQASRALQNFFEIFESREHVKCMDANKELPASLGGTFDELVRHHPPLKTAIINAVLDMVARVGYLCKVDAEKKKIGAKLWTTDSSGKVAIADANLISAADSGKGKGKAVDNGGDVEMQDVGAETLSGDSSSQDVTPDASNTPYINAVATFLSTMLQNPSVRADFCSRGGIEYVLDLADSPCLYSNYFSESKHSGVLPSVIGHLAESKPHLTMPSLLRRAQSAADILAPFANNTEGEAFFAPFVNPDSRQAASPEFISKGTSFAKALVNLLSLVKTLNQCFQPSAHFNHRSSPMSFNQLNIGDYYIRLIRSIGPLMGAMIREELVLETVVPEHWKNCPKLQDPGFGEPTSDTILGTEVPAPAPEAAEPESVEPEAPLNAPPTNSLDGDSRAPFPGAPPPPPMSMKIPDKSERRSPFLQNYRTILALLKPITISLFLQTVGKAIVTKRNSDSFQRQVHASIADSIADTMLLQLRPGGEANVENYKYWTGVLNALRMVLLEDTRHSEQRTQIITIVLQAFKDRSGFAAVNQILETFTTQITTQTPPSPPSEGENGSKPAKPFSPDYPLCEGGAADILSLYSQLVNGKNIIESSQTVSLAGRDRDRSRQDPFVPAQFLVELRMAVLPVVQKLWHSDLSEKGSDRICKRLIEVIRIIANADSESGASRRSDKVVPAAKVSTKHFICGSEQLSTLVEVHLFKMDLAVEALFRCNNNLSFALEYCREATQAEGTRNPIPEGVIAPTEDPTETSEDRTGASTGTATPDDAMAIDSNANIPTIVDSLNQIVAPPGSDGPIEPQNFSNIVSQFNQSTGGAGSSNPSSRPSSSAAPAPKQTPATAEEPKVKPVTLEDLNEEREKIRHDLIDKCLDVINAHGEVTFEIADLITTVVSRGSDPASQRKNVGATLVIALMSFASEEDLRGVGKKVAAYANLLALLLRDKSFYTEALDELKENLPALLSFVRLSNNHSTEEESEWIPQILLVVEMLLSEDARPRKTKWTAPTSETETTEKPVLEDIELSVSEDERSQLFEAILDILPRIGKDQNLAIAVLRILVILTRSRPMAQAMSEKKNIQRLFVMAKQLAVRNSRIQGPLMLILRHSIEDDETIKQIMRADIKSYFETSRQQRNVDPSSYLRGLAQTAIRQPELFVEVTNEMVKYNRWVYTSPNEPPARHISLVLKDAPSSDSQDEDSVLPTVQATEDLTIQDVKPSTEEDRDMSDAVKPAPEHKLPLVPNSDGVIHFLLGELLAYKEVDDAVPAAPRLDKPAAAGSSTDDTPMTGASTTPDSESPDTKAPKPNVKPEFKSEDHPIYIYRCFILQCLTELLSSYNSTKMEFISWSPKKIPQAMTPLKGRPVVVKYLLTDLIPIGTLDHAETIELRKKLVTSSWADSVLTALVSKTGEQPLDPKRGPYDNDDEPDLLHVRKFVLDKILDAFNDAIKLPESLDVKYARLLALSDLMSHIMSGKENVALSETQLGSVSQKQLRRIMYEKGFLKALTEAISDIDLNFPGAKRAIKYLLRPLRTLSTTAIQLSDLGLISDNPAQNDADEIESATSASDVEDEREETPDLFRNSTLGMFEPGREEDSSSESEDGMY